MFFNIPFISMNERNIKLRSLYKLAAFLVASGLWTASAWSADLGALIWFEVEKYHLGNGLTVLLHEDHSVPTISYHTWFRVGSRDETPGYTGIAHLFEHMMFKGAKRYSGKEFDRLLQSNGAVNNAFTSFDYTGYYENLPSDKLELVMDLESDRLVNLQISEENLKSEREVVKEERRVRVDNSVMGHLREVLFATVFKVHPYRWPVIGWMKDLNRIDLAKSREFYGSFYAPNNAVLVIAGDFDSSVAKELIKKYYGPLKASETLKKRAPPSEPEQRGYRFQKIKKDVQNSTFALAYKSSAAGQSDSYTLDLLANILGQGESSRLYRKLVYKEQIATSTGASNYTPADDGVFQIFVSLKPNGDFEQAKKSVLGEIFRVRNNPVSERELQKAKNQIMKGYVDSLKTVDGKAYSLALNEILFGDFEVLFNDLANYSRVTPEQILKAAQKYLTIDRANVVLVEPKSGL